MDQELRITRRRLHDGLCQQLTGAAMYARMVLDGMRARKDPNASDAEKLVEFLNGAVDEVQSIMSGSDGGE